MTTMTDEKVLVIPTKVLRSSHTSLFFEHGGFCNLCSMPAYILQECQFMVRQEVEENESYLQLIPYGITTTFDTATQQQILTYQRPAKGGDKRLRSLYSIGIGGHINPKDSTASSGQTPIHTTALRRECSEELIDWTSPVRWFLCGTLYDPSTPVGRVHLGLIYSRKIPWRQRSCIKPRKQAVQRLEWCTLTDLRLLDHMENWTKLLVEHCIESNLQCSVYF